jgi:hypothetical protein
VAPTTFAIAPACANTQILLGNTCVDCNSFMHGCTQCSVRNDSTASIQCDACDFGFFLLTLPANLDEAISSLPDDGKLSMCVSSCEDFALNFVSNQATRKCIYCGDGCTTCSSKFGCLDSPLLGHGYRLSLTYNSTFPFNAVQPTVQFQTIQPCNDPRCD